MSQTGKMDTNPEVLSLSDKSLTDLLCVLSVIGKDTAMVSVRGSVVHVCALVASHWTIRGVQLRSYFLGHSWSKSP